MRLITAPTWTHKGAPPLHFKGRRWTRRDPAKVDTLLVHQTAVPGGFGAKDLEARIARYCGSSMRKRGVPYHYVYSPKDGVVIALWHPRLYSYHGNGGNSTSVGFAVDGAWPGDQLDPDQLELATTIVLTDAKLSALCDLVHLESHRQHSKDRGTDPGADLWAPIVRACARRACYYRPRVTGTGRLVPDAWWADLPEHAPTAT